MRKEITTSDVSINWVIHKAVVLGFGGSLGRLNPPPPPPPPQSSTHTQTNTHTHTFLNPRKL